MGDVSVRGVYSYPGATSLFGLPEAYEPTFSFDPVTGKATGLGVSGISPYNALFSVAYNRWFVVGYPSAWFEYSPFQN